MAESELRREWGTVLAATIGVMASCITLVNYSLGVFVVPLSHEFDWSRRDIALATSYVSTGALVTSFVAGWLADRAGAGAHNPLGYEVMLWFFFILSLVALASALLLWRREAGPKGHGLEEARRQARRQAAP